MERREDVLIFDLCEEIDYLHKILRQVRKERDDYLDKWTKSIQASIKASANTINLVFAGMLAAGTKDNKLAKAILSSMNDGGKNE